MKEYMLRIFDKENEELYYFYSKEEALEYIRRKQLEYNPNVQIDGIWHKEKY